MTYNINVPRGDLLPLNERPRFSGNFTYIQTTQRLDHYWNESANNDGHHRKIEMTNLTDSIGAGNVDANGDPTALSAGMTGYYYVRPKTAAEAPTLQVVEPFFAQSVSGNLLFNQLGIRAMAVFDNAGTLAYGHNISSVAAPAAVNGQSNIIVVTFANALPSANYVVFGGAIKNVDPGATPESYQLDTQNNTVLANVKTANAVNVYVHRITNGNAVTDFLQAWVAIIGG